MNSWHCKSCHKEFYGGIMHSCIGNGGFCSKCQNNIIQQLPIQGGIGGYTPSVYCGSIFRPHCNCSQVTIKGVPHERCCNCGYKKAIGVRQVAKKNTKKVGK